MKRFRTRGMTSFTLSLLFVGVIACSGTIFNSTSGAVGSKKNPTTAGNSSSPNNPPASGGVNPPVEISGSFLTGVFANPDGDPLSNAGIVIVKTEYSTTTNNKGEFSIPVSKIPSGIFDMRVSFESTDPDSGESTMQDYVVETNLPTDLATIVETEKANTTINKTIDQRLGLLFPRAPIGIAGSESKYILPSTTLPKPEAAREVGILTKYQNDSTGASIRISWDALAGSNVVFAFGSKYEDISAWTNRAGESVPSTMEVVGTYDRCTDAGYRNKSSGSLDAFLGQCGILFTDAQAPFKNSPYYIRLAVQNGTKVLLSPVLKAQSAAPLWLQYHTEVESCYPDYNGPSLLGIDNNPDLTKFNATLPACDEARRGQTFCKLNPPSVTGPDASPSRCQSCESNLFICK